MELMAVRAPLVVLDRPDSVRPLRALQLEILGQAAAVLALELLRPRAAAAERVDISKRSSSILLLPIPMRSACTAMAARSEPAALRVATVVTV
jgi:hypothetical protein